MPVLKHAKKKLRQDKKRTATNKKVKDLYKDLVKAAKANPTKETVSKAFQGIDKATKSFIIHKNKAARLKSSLSKLVTGDKKPHSAEASRGKQVANKTVAASPKKAKAVTSKVKTPIKKPATKKSTK